MKRLALFVLLLSCLRSFAASSGTYIGDLPRTNTAPAGGRVIVDIPGLGTNSTHIVYISNLLASSSVPTNCVSFTNECHTVPNRNTNVLVVSGAGTAVVNGVYTNIGGAIYVKTATTHGIFFDGAFDWQITNSSGSILYTMTSTYPTNAANTTWTVGTGGAPGPSSLYDGITNCFTVPFYGGYAQDAAVTYVNSNTTRNVIYVNPGDNISNILANLTSGATVIFAPMTNQFRGRVPGNIGALAFIDLKVTNLIDVTLEGSGRTVFHATNDGMLFGYQQCSNLVIKGIEFRGTRTNNDYQVANVFTHGLVQAFGTNDNVTFRDTLFTSCNFFGLMTGVDDAGAGTKKHKTIRCILDNCQFVSCGYTNYVGGANNPDGGAAPFHQDATVLNCLVERCGRGIEAYSSTETTSLTIRDTVFRANWQKDIFINNGTPFTGHFLVDNCKFIADNTARKGGGASIFMVSVASGTIQNCLFTNNTLVGDYCIQVGDSSASGTDARNVSIINNTFSRVAEGLVYTHAVGGLISGNRFDNVTGAATIIGADSVIVTGNTYLDCSPASSPIYGCCGFGTNMLIADNRILRHAGSAPSAHITIDSSQRGTRVRDNIVIDRTATPLAYTISDSGVDSSIQFSDRITYAALTAGTYTNAPDDRRVFIPLLGLRTNKLATPYRGHTVSVVNGAQNATAVVVRATSGVIYNGSAFGGTNEMSLGTNQGASATFQGDGTNWFRLAQ